jgi:hypothetical protein
LTLKNSLFTQTVHLYVSYGSHTQIEIVSLISNNRLVFVMEMQCHLCEVGSELQNNTGVTSVENSSEGIMVNE